ncbi:MAG: circularly permuted type 2 ATP-grasp protein [Vicinamibacterales bacterium]
MASADPIAAWHALLRESACAATCGDLASRMRDRGLTFGGRLLCPFLRPFFLQREDERRVARAAEALWRLGERLAREAARDRALLDALGLSDAEIDLVSIDPGAGPASTAARADAFLLPESLQFAEYNAESPAGPAYSQGLAELFDADPLMTSFKRQFDARYYTPVGALLDALMATYREWGGTARPPRTAIVDWREVPTYSEFELLRDAFTAAGVPTTIHDPRDLEFRGGVLTAGGERIDFVYRRVLINDVLARRDECRALVDAYRAGAVCVANNFRCKIAHKKAFFAILTNPRHRRLFDPADLDAVSAHVPWTRVIDESHAALLLLDRERYVIKPNDEYGGSGVTLGWEADEGTWERALHKAKTGVWVAQERINIRRETFPICTGEDIAARDMLVDFAPYVFRGRVAGYLTRLSATGLANVTSGGGQVPAFVVSPQP